MTQTPLSALPLLGIPIALVGNWIYVRSRWPRRVGDALHCRKCGYLLSGNVSGVCPEFQHNAAK